MDHFEMLNLKEHTIFPVGCLSCLSDLIYLSDESPSSSSGHLHAFIAVYTVIH